MSHEKKPGMVKITIREFSRSEKEIIAKSANCTAGDVNIILDIIDKHFNKKKYVSLAELSNKSGLSIDLSTYLVDAINKVAKSPISSKSILASQRHCAPMSTTRKKSMNSKKDKEQNGTENEGPLISRRHSKNKPKK